MTHNETSVGSERTPGSESRHGRRRFVQLSGGAVAVGLAGCSNLGLGTGDEGEGTPEDHSGDAVNGTETESDTTTDVPTETEPGEAATETDSGGDIHEHGNLYLEIDGDRQSFDEEKYYQAGQYEDGEADHAFHFHPDGNDHYWHMHGERLTLQEALASLPGVTYESRDGAHVVEYEGETYEDGDGGTEIEIRQRDVAVDPTEYELQDGDIIWIQIETGGVL